MEEKHEKKSIISTLYSISLYINLIQWACEISDKNFRYENEQGIILHNCSVREMTKL